MALHLLPEEVLEQIAKEFTIKDLLTCSAVCLEWRNKFNEDVFWRKFCFKEIKDYLEDNKSEVEKTFFMPNQNEERLVPLCNWRIHYMRKVHLFNNWKLNKFSPSIFRTYSELISSDLKFCEGIHWFFIRTESEIEIWNINSTPQLHASVTIFSDCPDTSIFVVGKKVVITQWNILSIYDLLSPRRNLESILRFEIEEDKPLPPKLWNSTNKTDIDFINEVDDFRFSTFGNLLVGYKRIPNPLSDLSMHIWDLERGEKLKIESMLNSLSEENEIAFTNMFKIDDFKGMIRHVFRSPENVMCSQLFVYDFKKKKFTNTNIMFEGVSVWCGCAQDIMVTFTSDPGTIKFYNYLTGKLLSVKEIGIYTNSEQMQLIDSYLLYCMFNCMNVLDIHTQEIVYCLAFSFYSYVRRLTVIEPRFVVVWLLERGGSPGCPSYYQEVWDLKDLSSKLFQCSSDLGFEMVTNSTSIIKQVIAYNGMISVYTFW